MKVLMFFITHTDIPVTLECAFYKKICGTKAWNELPKAVQTCAAVSS